MSRIDQKLEYVDGDIEGVVIRPLKFFNDTAGLARGNLSATTSWWSNAGRR